MAFRAPCPFAVNALTKVEGHCCRWNAPTGLTLTTLAKIATVTKKSSNPNVNTNGINHGPDNGNSNEDDHGHGVCGSFLRHSTLAGSWGMGSWTPLATWGAPCYQGLQGRRQALLVLVLLSLLPHLFLLLRAKHKVKVTGMNITQGSNAQQGRQLKSGPFASQYRKSGRIVLHLFQSQPWRHLLKSHVHSSGQSLW